MHKLSTERRAQVLGMMVEGNSIRAIVWISHSFSHLVATRLHRGQALSKLQQENTSIGRRRERAYGAFSRAINLLFPVDPFRVKAV